MRPMARMPACGRLTMALKASTPYPVDPARLAAVRRRRDPGGGEAAQRSLIETRQPLRQPLVRRVHAGEERVAASVRHGQGIELGRLERLLVVGAVGVPALGPASIDGHVERAVRPELVDAQQGDLRMVGVPRALRRVRVHDAEAVAVAQEVVDLEVLARHHDDVVVEPRPIDAGELRVVELLDVDALDLGADLWPQAAYLHGRDPHFRSNAFARASSGRSLSAFSPSAGSWAA